MSAAVIEEMVTLWRSARCLEHPRLSAGGMTLLRDFNYWAKTVALTRGAFLEVLDGQGFPGMEAKGAWLVLGIALKEDAEAARIGVPQTVGEAAVVSSGSARPEVE